MKNKICLWLSIIIGVIIFSQAINQIQAATVKVATFNSGGSSDAKITGIANLIKSNSIQIVGLQEAKSSQSVAAIAKQSGLNNSYYQSTPAGNGIVSAYSASYSENSLPKCGETRGYQQAAISIGGKNITFINTHISYNDGCQDQQISALYEAIKNIKPIIIVGDFNVGKNQCATLTKYFSAENYNIVHASSDDGFTDSIIISNDMNFVSSGTVSGSGAYSNNHDMIQATVDLDTPGNSGNDCDSTASPEPSASPSPSTSPTLPIAPPLSSNNIYIDSNQNELDSYSIDNFANHLVYSGYQAYCAKGAEIRDVWRWTTNSNQVLDLSNAAVPLLRNRSFVSRRLNSAETYYGYAGAEWINGNNFLVESSWLSKATDRMRSACTLKVANLIYLYQLCEVNREVNCENLYTTASGLASLKDTGYTIKELVKRVGTEVTDPINGKSTYCTQIYSDQTEKEMQQALVAYEFFLSHQFTTGYIIQATRICPTPVYGGPRFDCHEPTCNWDELQDEVRVYPFIYPDLFNNKNFCDQADSGYPNSCVIDDTFSYINSLTEYVDPAQQQRLFAITAPQQETQREKFQAQREELKGAVSSASIYDNNPINCRGSSCQSKLTQAMVKMVNGQSSQSVISDYLGDNGGDNACNEGTTFNHGNITASSIYTLAANNRDQADTTTDNSYNDYCIRKEFVRMGIDAQGRSYPIYAYSTHYAKSRTKYWIVAPQSQELEAIDDQILATFYGRKNYTSFRDQDARYTRRMPFNGIKTQGGETVSLSMLGAGPITNIFLIQQSLQNKVSSLYQALASCRNIVDYFLGRCGSAATDISGGGTGPSGTTADEKTVIEMICKMVGEAYGAQVASEAVAIARAESSLNNTAVSSVGATGIFQIFNRKELYASLTEKFGVSYGSTSEWKSYFGGSQQFKDAIRQTSYYAKFSDPQANIANAIAKYASRGWCPWDVYNYPDGVYSGCGTNESQSWYKVGRGNYQNNQHICVDQGGSVVYNPTGDCGKSGTGCN